VVYSSKKLLKNFVTIQFKPGFLSHAGSRKERLRLAMLKSRHLGSEHTHGPLEAAGWLLSSPVMSCSESIDLIDGTDSDQEGVARRYSRYPRKLGR
jgi:hypothetical protein